MPIRTPGATVSPEAEQAPEPRALEPAPPQTPEPAPQQEPEPAPQQEPERAPQPEPGRVAAGLFGAVTVVPALLAAAWLLPGLPLLLAGRLTAPPLVFMFSPLAVGLCYAALRQQPARWPGFRAEPPDKQTRKAVPWWAVAATVAVAVVFAVWQIAERTQQVIVLGDPATYLQTASWIARHGSLPIPYSPEAFGGAHAGLTFASASYYPSGSGLSPAVMAGTPLVLAAAIWLAGVPAALVITPLTGACAVLSFGGLAGRLVGARWAPAAAAALALSLPEQYTSRGTFSEPLVQVLLFGGLCLLIDALLVPARPAAAARTLSSDPGQDRVLAALAGLVLGLAVLVRIDALSDILPAVPFLGLLLAARRRQGIPFGLGLAAGAGYGLAGGYLLSRPYLDLIGPSLRPLGLITAVIVALTAIALGFPVQNQLKRLRASKRATTWLPPAAAALVIAAFAALAVRPLLTNGRYDQSGLVWVIWYLGLPAVLLGAAGLAVLAGRGVKALATWTDPGAQAWTWALPLLVALWVIVTVLWRPAISPEQPWASRRLVPFVLPGLILGAIWATAWLRHLAGSAGGGYLAGSAGGGEVAGQRRRARATSGVVASCCAASLLIPATLTNLDLGSSPNASGSGTHLTANGMAFRRIGPGQLAAVNALCAAIGADASVVILDSLTADRFAQVARGTCDTPTVILDHPTAKTVGDALSGIERAGRRPVLIARDQSLLAPYGGGPRPVVNLLTTQEAHDLTAPATRTWPIQYTVWLSNPAGA
ncbi:MAG TPA: hypothetical protein VGY50_10815 [Streptosporangiaceae bacterium]|nr:hypothetical protein [Streptosporangiaceae bacterium]